MVRRILTELTSDEIKQIVAGQEKLKGDGNKDNYQKIITQIVRAAANRCKREFGEVELLNDGKLVLRYECMKDHELLVSILMELEAIRGAATFQADVLNAQLAALKPKEKAAEEANPKEDKKE